MQSSSTVFAWMDTTGITVSHIQGDATACKYVIYTGDTRNPINVTEEESDADMIAQVQKSMSHMVCTLRTHKGNITWFAFFGIASRWIDPTVREFHPVWGQVPATALVMSIFPKADIFFTWAWMLYWHFQY